MEQIIETWRDVVEYEGFYQVSNAGRVRSRDRVVDGPRVQQGIMGKVLRPGIANGYVKVVLCQNAIKKTCFIHRLVATAFLGRCPDGSQVIHIDGVKLNNRLPNLAYATRSEITLNAYRNGLIVARLGVDNPRAKLTESDVLAIRETYAAGGVTMQKLAEKYRVSHVNISLIILRKTWAHLPPA